MSGGILRFPWTSQPQTPVGIERTHPLAPTYVFNGGSGALLFGKKQYLSTGRGSGDGFAASKYGLGFKGAQVANGGLDFGAVQPITGDTFTVLVLANPGNGDGVSTLYSQRNGSAPFNQIDLAVNADTSLGSVPGQISCVSLDQGTLNSGDRSSATTYTDGNWHVYGATKVGFATIKLWFDGLSVALFGVSNAQTTSNISSAMRTRIGNIGDIATAGYGAACDIPLILIFDGKELSASEIALVSREMLAGRPYWAQPIQRTIWVPAAAGGATYTLTADSGSFALTGQDAGLAFNRTLAAASGSFALTGQDAGLAFNRVLSAANGSYALDGQDVTLTYTPISGATYTLGAASGSFALTGQDTGLAFNRVLTADTQSYSLSGDVAGLAFNRVLTADTVSYALTGQDASLSYTGFTYKLMADSASFALTGQDASFEFSGTTGVGGGGREKQRKKVLKDIKRLNELILKRDDEPDAEVTTVATPKPKAPKPAKFDTALITAKAKQQVIDDEEDELMLLMY